MMIASPALLTIAVSLAFGLWSAWLVYRYDPEPEHVQDSAPSGISGFLLLPAIGIALSPVLLLWVLARWVRLGELQLWTRLPWIGAAGYQPWHQYAYLAILAAMCAQILISLVTLFLFFTKRSSAPVAFVVFIWLGWLLALGSRLFDAALGLPNHTFTSAASAASEQFFVATAWSLYFFGSSRVKATFISRRAETDEHSKYTTKPWPAVIAQFTPRPGGWRSTHALGGLAKAISESLLATHLYASTSMFDLYVTKTEVTHPYNGPRLRIEPVSKDQLQFRYEDASDRTKRWQRTIDVNEAWGSLLNSLAELRWLPSEIIDTLQ